MSLEPVQKGDQNLCIKCANWFTPNPPPYDQKAVVCQECEARLDSLTKRRSSAETG